MRYTLLIALMLFPISAFAADFTLHPDWSVSLPASWGATISAGSARDVLANYPKIRPALKKACQQRWTQEEGVKVTAARQAITTWISAPDSLKQKTPKPKAYTTQAYPKWMQ